jgi:hypothetical protein
VRSEACGRALTTYCVSLSTLREGKEGQSDFFALSLSLEKERERRKLAFYRPMTRRVATHEPARCPKHPHPRGAGGSAGSEILVEESLLTEAVGWVVQPKPVYFQHSIWVGFVEG